VIPLEDESVRVRTHDAATLLAQLMARSALVVPDAESAGRILRGSGCNSAEPRSSRPRPAHAGFRQGVAHQAIQLGTRGRSSSSERRRLDSADLRGAPLGRSRITRGITALLLFNVVTSVSISWAAGYYA